MSGERDGGGKLAGFGPSPWPFLSYALLASLYLLYLPHADLVLDDWFQFLFYRHHQANGWAGELEAASILIQNRLYNTFQLYWLNFWFDSLMAWVLGYAPRVFFAWAVLLHALNAGALCRLLLRLRVAPRLAYLGGACFLLLPTSHGPLFWFLGISYYRVAPFFLFLYLLSLVTTLERSSLTLRTGIWQSLLIVIILFTGGAPSFCLLLFAGSWMALCFVRRSKWKLAARPAVLNWAVVAMSLAIYVPFINRVPPSHEQLVARYDFSLDFFLKTLDRAFNTHRRGLSGFGPHAYYRLRAETGQVLAAALAGLVVFVVACLLPARSGEDDSSSAGRAALFAAGMFILSYLPLAVLIGMTLRHYYTLSPYLSLFLIALCFLLPAAAGGFARIGLAALLCAYSAACTVAEIQQCWAPMSRNLQAVKDGLRRLRNLEPGDSVVIPGYPMVIGTAPNFALISAPWDRSFAEQLTGVKGLQFWREIVIEKSRPRLFHRHYIRDTSLSELARAHVLPGPPEGPYVPPRFWAEPTGPGQYRLHCLKDFPCSGEPGLASLQGVVQRPVSV